MRLLNVHNQTFQDFHGDDIPPYVVTSHRWGVNEAMYKDILKRRNQQSKGYQKVLGFCAFASRLPESDHGSTASIQWLWMDTCCINQNSSAEVSESINSMWRWYSKAAHCIAYLRDVRPSSAGPEAVMYDFRRSDWFERGWTLQELLAPRCVIFVTQEWEVIGRKSPADHPCAASPCSLNQTIAQVTHIPEDVLNGFESQRDLISDSTKMAWAANRQTTKVEDAAYCLLGIFDVHMSLIYGEGEFNARRRLQKKIKKKAQERNEPDFWFPIAATKPKSPPPWLVSSRQRSRGQRSSSGNSQPGEASSRPLTSTPSLDSSTADIASSDAKISTEQLDIDMEDTIPSIESSGRTHQSSKVSEDELCPKCWEIPLQPLNSTCGHSFCACCMTDMDDRDVVLIFEPLELDGHAKGEAMTQNFGTIRLCPVCQVRARFYHDTVREKQLQQAWPLAYAERAEHGSIADDAAGIITITIGNWHELVQEHHHRWSFFVKPSRTDIIEEVHMHLHESFPRPHKILKKPPYMIHGKGWGYFTITVNVILKPGFAWVSTNAEKGLDGAPDSLLRLWWTVDFESYKGRGSQGKCRVKVKRVQ